MDNIVATGLLWASFGAVIALVLIALIIVRGRVINVLLRHPSYAEKNKNKYFSMNSNEIILRSTIYPVGKKECILDDDTLVLNPDPKQDKDQTIHHFKLSQIAKVEITQKKHWGQGKFYFIRIWRNDIGQIDVPLKHRLPTHSFPFRPIALEAAREIERRFNNYVAPQKSE